MALIKCPECGKEISDIATSCPNCGYPMVAKNHCIINGIDIDCSFIFNDYDIELKQMEMADKTNLDMKIADQIEAKSDEYEELTDKIEEDEEERYYYLPNSYVFHDSELIEEYIDEIKNENIQEELEEAFYGKGKYRRFKETLRKFRIENDYYNFREEYLKNMAIEWCQKNNIEYEE